MSAKLTTYMRNALLFLRDQDAAYPGVPFWFREPSYSWPGTYGDFWPASLNALVNKALAERITTTQYRITDAGRAALAAQESKP